jgi:hydroxysqualene dehydroxylase
MPRTVHVVGAGLAGLAAAVRLAARGIAVVVHEAAGVAGGRCRSYHDPLLDMMIDNGNHLLLSGNHAALSYLDAIGSESGLAGPPAADFAFMDLASGERWRLRINNGRLPWWIFDRNRRVPGTAAADYFSFARLLYAPREKTVCAAVECAGPLYERFARPLWVAALNTDPKEASAALAGAILRETLAAGGKACRPLIARDGLGPVFIDPALRFLGHHEAKVVFGHRLRALGFADDRVTILDFGDDQVESGGDDVILAVPPVVAAALVPGLETPSEFRAIVNAHFRDDRVAVRFSRPIVGDDQRRRSSARGPA